jgi:hypothetical protein
VNVCFDLSQDFFDVSSQVVEIDLGIEQNAVRADDEGAAKGMTGLVVIDAEHPREFAGAIGAHGVLYLFQHSFVPLPGKVYEFGVCAHRNNFGARLLEFIILLRQSSKFRGSDEGKVGRVEEKDRPFFCRHLGREAYFAEIAPG